MQYAKMALEPLNALEKEECEALIHAVVDAICGRAMPTFASQSKQLSFEQFHSVTETLASAIRAALRDASSPQEVSASLQRAGLGGELAVLMAGCVEARCSEGQEAMLNAVAALSCGSLEDFDWQAKVALASDRVGSVQEPLVVLQLMVLEGGGVRKPHLVELNKAELDTLINSLESCSKVVNQLRTQ